MTRALMLQGTGSDVGKPASQDAEGFHGEDDVLGIAQVEVSAVDGDVASRGHGGVVAEEIFSAAVDDDAVGCVERAGKL